MLVLVVKLTTISFMMQESPQAARVKVLASGNATERRFRWDIYFSVNAVIIIFVFNDVITMTNSPFPDHPKWPNKYDFFIFSAFGKFYFDNMPV